MGFITYQQRANNSYSPPVSQEWDVFIGNKWVGTIHKFKEGQYQYWVDHRKTWSGVMYTTLIDCKKSLEREIKCDSLKIW